MVANDLAYEIKKSLENYRIKQEVKKEVREFLKEHPETPVIKIKSEEEKDDDNNKI